MKCRRSCLLMPLLMLLPLYSGNSAVAQEHKAHVHGSSSLLVAVEAEELVVELTAPADDIVGFEHAPKNEAQEHQVEAALEVLQAPGRMFALPAAAQCEVEAVRVLESLPHGEHEEGHDHDKAKHDGHKDDDHKHGDHKSDDHDHGKKAAGKAHDDHDDDGETHSEFRLRYHFHCHAMNKLAGMQLLMFDRFPRMHKVRVQMISARGQKTVTLDHDNPRLSF